MRAGEVDRVLVTDPDRLARNYVQLMVLLEELERAGCEVAFLDRPMGRDPQDQLLLQIRGAVAEYERTLIAERMRRGRQAKLRAGCLLPWTRPPYGYRLDPDRPRDPAGVTLEPAEAAVVRELFAGYLEGQASLFGLAKHLQALGIPSPRGRPCWSPATLRGLLTNPTYTGQAYAGRWRARAPRIRRSATHPIGKPSDSSVPVPAAEWLPVASVPALVSEEQFAQAQAKLARNRAFARRHNTRHAYLLRALVSCGLCRSSCLCRTVHPGYAYYVCRGKGDPLHSGRDEPCPARYAPAPGSTSWSGGTCARCSPTPSTIAQALARAHGGGWLPQELQARREQLRQGRRGLQGQLERLTEAYLLAVIPLPEYQRRRQALEQRLEALGAQADQLEAQVDRQAELAGLGGLGRGLLPAGPGGPGRRRLRAEAPAGGAADRPGAGQPTARSRSATSSRSARPASGCAFVICVKTISMLHLLEYASTMAGADSVGSVDSSRRALPSRSPSPTRTRPPGR